MSVVHWAQSHRRSILFLVALLALGGIAAGLKVSVSLFPNVQFPRIVVHVDAGDRPADQMALQVTRPVEIAVRNVPGVRNVRSTTSRGSADIQVDFGWGRDMARALLEVESAVNQTMNQLPAGTSFSAERRDPTVFPVIAYSLTSDTQDPVALHDFATYTLVPLLSRVNGVAHVGVQGGREREYRVTVDPGKLQAHGLALADVASALAASNVLQAVGRVEDHYKLYLYMADDRLKSLDDIRHTVLTSGGNGVIEVSDVATVSNATVPAWQRVTADGHDAVLLQVYQQPGGNTVQIDSDIRKALAAYKPHFPRGVTLHNWYDQSQLITAAAHSVRDAIIIGALLAAVVLWVFLRNLKLTLLATIVVPTVLAVTILLLYVGGMSFNIMTLGGMAAAVGLIIDDAIVMFEHIIRRMRGAGGSHHGRVMAAAAEFSGPLAGSSASTIIIFAPLAFLSGVTGAFFKALSLTMVCALATSFVVAWLAVPLLADKLLGQKDTEGGEGGRFTRRMQHGYRRVMNRLYARPLWLLAGLAPLLVLGYLGYSNVGSGFMPTMDEGGFILDYRTAPGTSLAETDRLLRQVGAILNSTPEVSTYSRRTGAQLGGGITEANEGDFFVRLKPLPRRPIEQVMAGVRQRVLKQVPGVDIEMSQLMEDLIGDLTAVPQPVEIKLYGDNQQKLLELAPKVAKAISQIKGIVDVKNGVVLAGDAVRIDVDRTRAALAGVSAEDVTRQLDAALSGTVTTSVQKNVKMVGVRVWLPRSERANVDVIGRLRIRAPDGHVFPLSKIAAIHLVTGQPQLVRNNLKPMVAVTARISGRDLGSTIADVKRALAKPGLVDGGVTWDLGGLYRQQQIAFKGLITVFVSAVALVFALLLFLYERFRTVCAIIVVPLLAVCAVFIGLWATGIELNITAMMGMTMIVGIVTEVAIFYFSELRELEPRMPLDDALIEAGINRMRPIAMTTVAAILALAPLALAIGQGSAMQQPLAVAIISGLLVQLPLVLVAMPILYRALGRRRSGPLVDSNSAQQ